MAAAVPIFVDASEVSEAFVLPVDGADMTVGGVDVPVRVDNKDCRSVTSCDTEAVPPCVICAVDPVPADVAPLWPAPCVPAGCACDANPLFQLLKAISARDMPSDNPPGVLPVKDAPPAEPADAAAQLAGSHPLFWLGGEDGDG